MKLFIKKQSMNLNQEVINEIDTLIKETRKEYAKCTEVGESNVHISKIITLMNAKKQIIDGNLNLETGELN